MLLIFLVFLWSYFIFVHVRSEHGGSCHIYVICVYLRMVSNTYFVVFLCFVCLRPVYPVLPVSLDCPFLIAPSVFSTLTFIFVLCLVYAVLPVSLDCPFLIDPSVFFDVYFRSVSCVPGVASVSGLSILDCPLGALERLFSSCVLCTRCCQCLWIVHFWLPFGFL